MKKKNPPHADGQPRPIPFAEPASRWRGRKREAGHHPSSIHHPSIHPSLRLHGKSFDASSMFPPARPSLFPAATAGEQSGLALMSGLTTTTGGSKGDT